jgi:dTDP-glucose 4,6-dehydratase
MILVTGGAGFIGSNFVLDWLSGENEPLVNINKLTDTGNPQNLSALNGDQRHMFVRCNIGDAGVIAGLLGTHQPRAVVNFAAESHVDRSIHGPDDFIQTNIVGTVHLLETVWACWTGLSGSAKPGFRLLHVSTDEAYGSLGQDEPAFRGTNQYQPNRPYSASKAASDHPVHAYNHIYGCI